MPTTRRRRIVRRAVMALAVVVLLPVGCWLTAREPPEIARSRAISLGMTELEVLSVMGQRQLIGYRTPSPPENWIVFGEGTNSKAAFIENWNLRMFIKRYPELRDWPVRVRLDANNKANRIERGDEVEEAPQQ